jgi:phosphoesterase RecJ-like protein
MSVNADFVYESSATAEAIGERLMESERVLILTHTKPDGDAIGSCLSLHRGLRQVGIGGRILLAGPIDPNLAAMIGPDDNVEFVEQVGLPDIEPDRIVILDTGALSQLEAFVSWLAPRYAKTIGIDHHARGDNVASMRLIDTSCAAAVETLVPVLEAMGVDLAEDDIATTLFMGLATDTGWFKFSSAGPRVYRLAARLMEAGANKDELYEAIEQQSSLGRVAVQGRALSSLQLVGSFAITQLTLSDFAETGAKLEDLAGIVNMPMEVGEVRASIMLVEFEPGTTKMSFRSKPAIKDLEAVDVNELAAKFGGGGHVHAAGARIKAPIAEARATLDKVLTAEQ